MNNSIQHLDLEEYKIQASILLKNLKSHDPDKAAKAFTRIRTLGELAKLLLFEVQVAAQRKHALAVIAHEQGFTSWNALKAAANAAAHNLFSAFHFSAFINHWFNNYAEAKAYQQSHGGFLLPYKNQFFICEQGYIQHIGIDPDDPHWELIAWDWAKPSDQAARQSLYQQFLKANRWRG